MKTINEVNVAQITLPQISEISKQRDLFIRQLRRPISQI